MKSVLQIEQRTRTHESYTIEYVNAHLEVKSTFLSITV